MKITRTDEAFPLDVKRLHLPVKVEMDCPHCGEPWECDLNEDRYMGFPTLGVPEDLYGYCNKCEREFTVMVVLEVTLTPAPVPKEIL